MSTISKWLVKMKRTEIEALLPIVFQRAVEPSAPLAGVLEVMADLITPCEEALDRLDDYLDPYRTPDRFVPMLASWVDLDRFLSESPNDYMAVAPEFPSGSACLRELIANAAYLSKWRGTARGLLRFLETATGVGGFTIDEQPVGTDGQPEPFHLSVHAPVEASPYQKLIDKIVAMEKPVYVTYDLIFDDNTHPGEGA